MEWFYEMRDEVVRLLRAGKTVEFLQPASPHLKIRNRLVVRLISRSPERVREELWHGDELLLEEIRPLDSHAIRNRLQSGWAVRIVD
jgi:23S rRNA A2030 N6-methylase RlmJ